jgi:hypothetical protein
VNLEQSVLPASRRLHLCQRPLLPAQCCRNARSPHTVTHMCADCAGLAGAAQQVLIQLREQPKILA